jgi:hypothetical protein
VLIPLSDFQPDIQLGLDAFKRKHGDAFLVVEAHMLGPGSALDTGNIPVAAVKESLAMGTRALVALPLKKSASGPGEGFAFISIGRHPHNDVCLQNDTVSRFHAYMKTTPQGTWQVVDGRSQHGTWLGPQRVPAQGDAPPTSVPIGSTVRFGNVNALLFNAAALVGAVARR